MKTEFQQLIKWSYDQFSHLPWRNNRTLYSTLVSEFMLQQTTVGTVLNHFELFMQKYPDIKTLSSQSEDEILRSWKGLGYYRRARNLLKASQYIYQEYQGEIPLKRDKLLAIPGIGPYTSNAILAIGANQHFWALDANIIRVITRIFNIQMLNRKDLINFLEDFILKDKTLNVVIKKYGGTAINEAMMDLGRTICVLKNPKCLICPLQKKCQSFQKKIFHQEILNENKIKQKLDLHLIRLIILNEQNEILTFQKPKKSWLESQWELPTFILESEDKSLNQYEWFKIKENKWPDFNLRFAFKIKSSITKYRIQNDVYVMNWQIFKKSMHYSSKLQYQFKPLNFKQFSTLTDKILLKEFH